jgi:hypothetical protein
MVDTYVVNLSEAAEEHVQDKDHPHLSRHGSRASLRTMETMVGGERGVEGSGSEVVEGELGLWEQVVPSVRREGGMGSREVGDKMVFGSTNCSFRREKAMVVERDVLKGDGDRAKERGEAKRSPVVEEKMGQRVRKGVKKGNNRLKGRHVGRGSTGHHGVQVDVPMMQDDE